MDYIVEANNTATESENKIHDDDVARQYGFRGGLVPGVDVWAYLAHPPAHEWRLDWLAHGTMSARFLQPVYDGETTVVHAAPSSPGRHLALEVRNAAGAICATGSAELPVNAPPPPPADDVPTAPLPEGPPPPASASALAPGTLLGSLEVGFHADKAGSYLDDVREELALYRDEGVAHPGWLLRWANAVLVLNVALGPWIHVASSATHFGLVRDGQRVSTRARVLDEYERKGHRFVDLDVLIVADTTTPVMRVRHTAIYEPRRT